MRYPLTRNMFMTRIVLMLYISLVILLVGCSALKEAKLKQPTWFGMEAISPNIYVSKAVTETQREQLMLSMQQAKSRVNEIYGNVVSSPVVYACADRNCYKSFNGYGNGRAVGASGILLISESLTPEVISHEWSHVELYVRMGRIRYGKFPMWFHEGLAVVVSKLTRHSDEALRQARQLGIPIPKDIKMLGEQKVWNSALKQYHNDKGINVMYAAAGHEVREWLRHAGTSGLQQLIDDVNAGEDFSMAYDRIAPITRENPDLM
jgi:hypothetical protein